MNLAGGVQTTLCGVGPRGRCDCTFLPYSIGCGECLSCFAVEPPWLAAYYGAGLRFILLRGTTRRRKLRSHPAVRCSRPWVAVPAARTCAAAATLIERRGMSALSDVCSCWLSHCHFGAPACCLRSGQSGLPTRRRRVTTRGVPARATFARAYVLTTNLGTRTAIVYRVPPRPADASSACKRPPRASVDDRPAARSCRHMQEF